MDTQNLKWTDLGRTFSEAVENDEETGAMLRRHGLRPAQGWDWLTASPLVVILNEAGAGKTGELRGRMDTLRKRDEQAFFLRLERLCASGGEEVFESPEDSARFFAWRRTRKPASFFLDALDEAKLPAGPQADPLHAAVRRLETMVGPAWPYARLVISSRPSAWSAGLELVEVQRLAARFRSLGVKPRGSAPIQRIVRLDPLNDSQQGQLAEFLGAPEGFMADLRQSGMSELATTPLDLIDFLDAYRRETDAGRIGAAIFASLTEVVDAAIDRRLTDFGATQARSRLSPPRARTGARRLAYACLMGQTLSIRAPGVAGEGVDAMAALDGMTPPWSREEVDQLLVCGLFTGVWAGRVRFTHRRRLDRLAAEAFAEMLDAGMEVDTLGEWLTPSAFGEVSVPPAFQEAVGWLATLRPDFRRHVLVVAPHLLLELGDPGALPIAHREAALVGHLARYNDTRRRGEYMARRMIRRFADPHLEQLCVSLLEGDAPEEPLGHLLVLAEEGGFAGAVAPALNLLADETRELGLRESAARAIGLLGDAAARQKVRKLALRLRAPAPAPTPAPAQVDDGYERSLRNDLRQACVEACLPDAISFRDALAVLGQFEARDRRRMAWPSPRLVELLSAAPASEELETARRWLSRLCWAAPPRRLTDYERPGWTHCADVLLPILEAICVRCLEERPNRLNLPALAQDVMRLVTLSEMPMSPLRIGRDEGPSSRLLMAIGAAPRFRRHAFHQAEREAPERGHAGSDLLETLWRRFDGESERQTAVSADLVWLLEDYAAATDEASRKSLRMAVFDGISFLPRADQSAWKHRMTLLGRRVQDETVRRYYTPTPWEHLLDAKAAARRAWRRRRWLSNSYARKEAIRAWRLKWRLQWNAAAIAKGKMPGYVEAALWTHMHGDQPFAKVRETYGDVIADAVLAGARLFAETFAPTTVFSHSTRAARLAAIGWRQIALESPDLIAALDAPAAERLLRLMLTQGEAPDWCAPLWATRPALWRETMGAAVLQDMRRSVSREGYYHGPALALTARQPAALRAELAKPVLEALVERAPRPGGLISDAARIIEADPALPPALEELAQRRTRDALAEGELELAAAWLAIWGRLAPAPAFACVRAFRDRLWGAAGDVLMQRLLGTLAGNLRLAALTPDQLADLAEDVFTHIRPDEDNDRDGDVTPRHQAQDFRAAVLSALSRDPSPDARAALESLSTRPAFRGMGDWLRYHLRDQVAVAVAPNAWSERDVADFANKWLRRPASAKDLHDLIARHLRAIVHELGVAEFDLRGLVWRAKELDMRAFLGQALEARSRGWFGVTQETVTSGEKRTDLRIEGRTDRGEIVVVELKMAGHWSGDVLVDKLESQLLGQYLISRRVRHGIYLVIDAGGRTNWSLAGADVSLDALAEALRTKAETLARSHPEVHQIEVIVLSVRPPPPRKTKRKGSAA